MGTTTDQTRQPPLMGKPDDRLPTLSISRELQGDTHGADKAARLQIERDRRSANDRAARGRAAR